MTCQDEDEAAAGMSPRDGQENRAVQSYRPQDIPSMRELNPATVRAVADAALRLFEALEAETCTLSWHLQMFRERMASELFLQSKFDPQPPADRGGPGAVRVTAAESAASTSAEARERVAAKRAARLANEVPS